MHGLVQVYTHYGRLSLIFASREYADQFARFVGFYVHESGREYKYIEYGFVDGSKVRPISDLHADDGTVVHTRLNAEHIEAMSAALCDVRQALLPSVEAEYNRSAIYMPMVGVENGVISFHFLPSQLPPRIIPEVGDVARVVGKIGYEGVSVRVERIKNGLFFLSCMPGYFNQPIEVSKDHVMKICDMMKTLSISMTV